MSTHNSEYADQGPKIIAVTLVLFVSATIPVVLRLYLRLSTKPRTYGADDTLIVGAWVCSRQLQPTIWAEHRADRTD